MTLARTVGILLIIAGTAGLIYGGFSYTKKTHEVGVGTLQFNITEKEYVSVPTWAGAGAIGIGAILLLVGGRRH